MNIGVMCSGGADSMLLLHLLASNPNLIKTQLFKSGLKNIELDTSNVHVFHFNHGINQSAEEWEKVVANYIDNLNNQYETKYQLHIERLNLDKTASETECREKRYEKLHKLCQETDCELILTGHHKTDQLENQFISVMRNRTNTPVSMPAIHIDEQKLVYVKPFLTLYSKEEILEKVKALNIPFVQDESNFESINIRNVIRNDFVPNILKLNGGESYLSNAQLFFEHHDYLQNFYKKQIAQLHKIACSNKCYSEKGYRCKIGLDLISDEIVFTSLIQTFTKSIFSNKQKNEIISFYNKNKANLDKSAKFKVTDLLYFSIKNEKLYIYIYSS